MKACLKSFCAFFFTFLLFQNSATANSEALPLPDPLTLEAAIELQQAAHPALAIKQHSVAIAKDRLGLADSATDLEIGANARARYVEPPEQVRNLGREDHAATIFARKTLYDFGRTAHQVQSAQEAVEIAELELQQYQQLRRLEIMQAFFNVILSDLQFNYDNEAMAIYYIQYDRARERQELGQLSEIDVLQKQSEYLEIRRNRFRSEAAQRTARVNMSEVLDRPSQIISRFVPPKLEYHKNKLIEVSKLEQHALANNLELVILRKQRDKAREIVKSLRSNRLPVVSAQAEAGLYSREMGSNDAWRVGVGVDIPLYQGGRVDYAVAAQNKIIDQINLEIYQKELALKKEVLSLWLAIDVLQKQKQSSEAELDYRELYLDRARSLYEMEVKTDLGDSMVALTAAARYEAETEFEIAIKWEKLRYLTQMRLEDMRQ